MVIKRIALFFAAIVALSPACAETTFPTVSSCGTNCEKYPDGTIKQWGTATPSSGTVTVTFPVPFTSAPFVFTNYNYGAGAPPATAELEAVMIGAVSATSFTGQSRFYNSTVVGNAGNTFNWLAIGK